MDLQYNAFLKGIMEKHNTDKWNSDCENDPEYGTYDPTKDYGGEVHMGYDELSDKFDVELSKQNAEKMYATSARSKELSEGNRRTRRAATPKEPKTNVFAKATGNNRTLNKARKNNRLFLKMADFYMKIESAKHIGRLKRA